MELKRKIFLNVLKNYYSTLNTIPVVSRAIVCICFFFYMYITDLSNVAVKTSDVSPLTVKSRILETKC